VQARKKPMLLKVFAEFALAVLTLIVGSVWWQLQKRKAFVREVVTDQVLLHQLIGKESLANPVPRTQSNPNALLPIQYFAIELTSDRKSQRIPALMSLVILLAVFVSSYFVGSWYLLTNVGCFLLLGLAPATESAKQSANGHVVALATILRRWRLENASECDAFVAPRDSLHKLYDAVKRLETV
jgi:hypothetical protein